MAIGTSTQYPRTSSTGAIAVPPRDKSTNPIRIVTKAAVHSAIDLTRGLKRADGDVGLPAWVSDIAR